MSGNTKLFASTVQKWKTTNVVYKTTDVDGWKDKKPASESPKDLLDWANAHPFIKVASIDVPMGIFPHEANGTRYILHDIKVAPPRRRKGMSVLDDDVYDMFEHVRTYVPRGFSILEISGGPNPPEFHVVVYAMKKFTGGPGDDDDEDDETTEDTEAPPNAEEAKSRWEYYFIAPHKSSTIIYRTTKENGDSAHLSFFKHRDRIHVYLLLGQFDGVLETYYLIGSKNVHLLVKDINEIDKYNESRFMVAKLIGKEIIPVVEKLPQKNEFIQYL